MPVTRRHSLGELGSAIDYYYRQTKRRVTYEHIFFDGVNDTELEVAHLIKFARRVPCKINVIPFHSIEFTKPMGLAASLRPSPKISAIVERLRRNRLAVFVRSNAGEDIDAACGQLVAKSRLSKSRRAKGTGRFSSAASDPTLVITQPFQS